MIHHMMLRSGVYEVRPRKDKRGVDLVSDVLPLGRLWYGEPNAISNAIGYAKFRSRSDPAVIHGLRYGWQRDRNARAQGRVQRVVRFCVRCVTALLCAIRRPGLLTLS